MGSRLVPHPDVLARQLDDSTVLVHLDTNRIFTLNPTGGHIWQLLADGRRPEELEAVLCRQYDVDATAVREELANLIDQLVHERLLVEADEP